MKHKPTVELPSATNRVASILREPGLRQALAELADAGELSPRRSLDYVSEAIGHHLAKPRTAAADETFFRSRMIAEAIVLVTGRPVLLVTDGVFAMSKVPALEKNLAQVREAMTRPIRAVGRIELSDHDTYDWCGTGWRVDEDLIVTNRHVALLFAERQGREFKFRLNNRGKRIQARIDFREEYKGEVSEEYGIGEILWIAEDSSAAPDMAILRVRRAEGLPPPVELAASDAKPGDFIGVVSYPARDGRNEAGVMSEIFEDIYDVKRFAPGDVVTSGADDWFLTHDASTLGGDSGAAVIDLRSQKAVGLHFGGSFRKANFAVKLSVIKSLIAQQTPASVSVPAALAAEEFQETLRSRSSMKSRTGYDRDFLGVRVALPKPGRSHQVLTVDGLDAGALPYTHFSIVMSKSRRLPVFTAENLDGGRKIRLKRRDSWGFDPRIPKSAQLGHDEFYGPEPFDKGHMVRRENPGWGDSEAEAQLGEDDTFVYTNCIPQMPQLNQKTWLALENYVLENSRTEGFRVCVFTGPVFRGDDPTYRGVAVPTEFWKVVVAIDGDTGGLLASAYLLSQEGLMPTEAFRYGVFRTYQVPLSRVVASADVKFPRNVLGADVFGQDEAPGAVPYLEITSPEDIVLGASPRVAKGRRRKNSGR